MSPVSPIPPGEEPGLRFWWVREVDRVCGPYTGKQMLTFLLKGRIRPETQVRAEEAPGWRRACEDPEFARYLAGPALARIPGTGGEARRRMPNFLIVVDGFSCPMDRVESVVGELGPNCRLTHNIFLLQCGLQLEKIRTYLARQLASIERLFIVDMRTGAWAGHNHGDELEENIGRLIEADGPQTD